MLSFSPVITNVIPIPYFQIMVSFDTGETFFFKPELKGEICKPLINEKYFATVKVITHKKGIEWPNGYSLGSDTVYEICRKGTKTV